MTTESLMAMFMVCNCVLQHISTGSDEPESSSVLKGISETTVVRVIQATCLPAQYFRLVHVSVDNYIIFTKGMLDELGRMVTCVIRNQGVEPLSSGENNLRTWTPSVGKIDPSKYVYILVVYLVR